MEKGYKRSLPLKLVYIGGLCLIVSGSLGAGWHYIGAGAAMEGLAGFRERWERKQLKKYPTDM